MAKKQSKGRDHSNDPNRQPLSGPQELFLKRLFYERFPGAGYHELYEAVVREAPSSLPHIYRNQELYHRNKQPPPKRDIRRIQATSVSRVYQLDLIDMGEGRVWNGYRYILNVVDVASRKLFLEPLKKKTEDTVYLAFKKIAKHEHFGNKPTIHMDNGGEFAALKRDPNIRCVLGKPHVPMGQGMVESLNKQVRRYVNMYLQQGYKDWPMAIPRFQDSLNSLSRRGTGGLSANEAHEMPKEESKAYFEDLKAKRKRNDDPLNDNLLPLGATVRY
ncbi:hypothetical protein GGF32_007816 [Allomyces javanicus]|nr:hypothetical protein GGF32_007816 [Allomyces javanicus]